jgi:hypothetical protein
MTDQTPTATDEVVDERAERIVGRHLSHLAKKGSAQWAEDDTAIGGQAANIVRQLREAGLLA